MGRYSDYGVPQMVPMDTPWLRDAKALIETPEAFKEMGVVGALTQSLPHEGVAFGSEVAVSMAAHFLSQQVGRPVDGISLHLEALAAFDLAIGRSEAAHLAEINLPVTVGEL